MTTTQTTVFVLAVGLLMFGILGMAINYDRERVREANEEKRLREKNKRT